MKRTDRTESSEKAVGDFKLKLPSDLQIKPDYEFKVSPKCTMYVYKIKKLVVRYNQEGQHVNVEVDGYSYIVRGESGRTINTRYHCDDRGFTENLLELKIAAENISYALKPKKRTTKQEIEEDDDF